MRVAVFHNQPPGGARRALAGFCAALRADHDVAVYSLTSADDEWIRDADLGVVQPRVAWQASPPVRHGLWLDELRRWHDLTDLDHANARAAAQIDADRHDVVLVDACRTSLVPTILGHLRTPTACYVHEGPGWTMGRGWRPTHNVYERARDAIHAPAARLVRERVGRAQGRAARSADLVLANSWHTARHVQGLWGIEPVVCPPGVDMPPVSDVSPRAGLLSVGEIEPRKGFTFLVDALATIPADRRPPLQVFAHRATEATRAALLDRAVRRGVDVDIVEGAGDDALASAYQRAALYLHGNHSEPLGLAPIEAMAHGCPVVAVAEGGILESVVDGATGRIVPRDPARFGEVVQSLVEDEPTREALGRQARDHTQRHWSWAVRGPAIVDHLAGLAARPIAARSAS